jgi:hypothetical protein
MADGAISIGWGQIIPGPNEKATARVRRSLRFGARYLALILGGVLVAACSSATTQQASAGTTPAVAQLTNLPSPTASGPTSQTFSSDLYGFELVLPSPWQIQRASTAWVSGVLEGRCPSDWDCFSDTTGARTLAVAAIDVPQSTTLEDWQAKIHASAPSGVIDSDPPSGTTLDGQPALTWTAASADEGVNVIKLVALHGTRAYVALFVSPMTTSVEADKAVFAAIIGTFKFTAP